MKHFKYSAWVAGVLFAGILAGCTGGVAVNKEASTSAIRVAEESGAMGVPSASLYLQYAKEELTNAKGLAERGDKEEAESMLQRVQADAELAAALSRGDADAKEATEAIERARQLRLDNQLPPKRN